MEHELLDFMIQVSKSGKRIIKICSVNMYFIVNEYDEVLNYEDIMSKPFTKKEKKGIIRYGGVAGWDGLTYYMVVV